MCTAKEPVYSTCANGTFKCCPTGQACVVDTNGAYGCDVPVGGICGNNGNGQCNGGFSRCNAQGNPSICGGAGALCDFNNNTVCVPSSPCKPGPGQPNARCGGEGAPCTSNTQCANGSTGNLPNLTCKNGTCQP